MMPMYANIIIVGITGVGKTTIGKFLAESIGKQFLDLDKEIEMACGVDIPTIFELEGESGFRDRETACLNYVLANNSNYVLSLGGGCVIRPENRQQLLRSNSLIVQLVADLDIIVDRLNKSPNKRPLLADVDMRQKIQSLFDSRKGFYDAVSDITINTSRMKPIQVIDKISEILNSSTKLHS